MSNGAAIRVDVHHHIELGSEVVRLILERIDLLQETIMATADDLRAAIATLTQNVADNAAEALSEIADLKAALTSGNQAAIDEAVANLTTLNASLADTNAKLRADNQLPPVTLPTP